jgi:iron complex outermembrane receptor protein
MQVRKNMLALSIVAALGVTGTATAQDAPKTDPKDLDTVVVTGIRGSVEKSLDVKREAKGHVEVVTPKTSARCPTRTWPTRCSACPA